MLKTLYQCPICKTVFASQMVNPHCPIDDQHDEWTDLIRIGEINID